MDVSVRWLYLVLVGILQFQLRIILGVKIGKKKRKPNKTKRSKKYSKSRKKNAKSSKKSKNRKRKTHKQSKKASKPPKKGIKSLRKPSTPPKKRIKPPKKPTMPPKKALKPTKKSSNPQKERSKAPLLSPTPGVKLFECGVSEKEIQTLVNRHNDLRKQIARGQVPNQPRGTNLKKLQWDKSLAKAGDSIARTGIFAHKKVVDRRFGNGVGQNLHMKSSSQKTTGADWITAVDSWFVEHKMYHYGPQRRGDPAGHYTQVVWANTSYIGCGYCHFTTKQSPEIPFHKIYVCNYGPPGNFIGEVPYAAGMRGCENLC